MLNGALAYDARDVSGRLPTGPPGLFPNIPTRLTSHSVTTLEECYLNWTLMADCARWEVVTATFQVAVS